MKVSHSYDNKKRFFEVFQKVNKGVLAEAVLEKKQKEEIIYEFIDFVKEKIELPDIPNIDISYNEKDAQDMKSFGLYTGDNLLVVAANRNLADILRTIAHELVHHKQGIEGRIKPNSNETGSDIENEANALAGVLMRDFAQIKPIIFE